MKIKSTLSFLFLITNLVQAQNNGWNLKYEVLDPSNAGKIFHNAMVLKNKPKGSPYLEAGFAAAKVANVTQTAFMRYNVCLDEFEFITPKKDTLILDKIDDFKIIFFTATNKKYYLKNYSDSGEFKKGYLISLYEAGGFVLYKKENNSLSEGKIAKTSLERDMPAKYTQGVDTFFLGTTNNKIFNFPKNKKQLIKLFPNQKERIENFIKENEIDFQNVLNLIKIIDFIVAF